ncbi:serpin B6 [Caerostris extrusa]|uniref:Serpin B6 n=1 Tax=Caerostris extrusa TaxID=172846 RepID=A0AAV4MF95_CAEEX|nr:serpin B6 [Caerostris extrusa]
MIPNLLESLNPATVMVILNAVYFKGFWMHQFDKEKTFLQHFYNKGRGNFHANFVTQCKEWIRKIGNFPNPKFCSRPNTGNDQKKSEVALPKFKLEYSKSLKKTFISLGLKRIFGAAQLDGLSDYRDVQVSKIIHKAVIEVNEEGSEASAATAIIMVRCLKPKPIIEKFIVDHPFMFVIYNSRNNLILFMGRVNEL